MMRNVRKADRFASGLVRVRTSTDAQAVSARKIAAGVASGWRVVIASSIEGRPKRDGGDSIECRRRASANRGAKCPRLARPDQSVDGFANTPVGRQDIARSQARQKANPA